AVLRAAGARSSWTAARSRRSAGGPRSAGHLRGDDELRMQRGLRGDIPARGGAGHIGLARAGVRNGHLAELRTDLGLCGDVAASGGPRDVLEILARGAEPALYLNMRHSTDIGPSEHDHISRRLGCRRSKESFGARTRRV